MLRLDDGSLVLAATDLTNHLACPHLTQQRLGIARGERSKPPPADDPHAELIRERGEVHEAEVLKRLAEGCGGYLDLSDADRFPRTREELEAAAARTVDAMRTGEPLIFQAQFFDGRWQGRTDFLRRTPQHSSLGEYSYEVLDTKLARQVKPHFVHQLSLYNRLLAEVQGYDPAAAHVLLGDGTEVPVDLRLYAALHRHVCRQLEEITDAPTEATHPEPVSHCGICALARECNGWWVETDHLSLVAGARREWREKLVDLGIGTVLELAQATDGADPGSLGPERFDVLHHQAALQVESRDTGQPRHRHLDPARAAGYALLPPPSPGDVFFDLEGDPYIGDGGIEYLWGWWTADGGYECVWAHDADAEKAAFEAFMDLVMARRREHPDLHVFHYAPHERSKLRSLSVQYATREAEVDELLRAEVLVDLYAVVRQALQVGETGYGLKKLERHHAFARLEQRVREGGGSIVVYEAWLETGDAQLLEAIRAYNEEDCRSTLSLRDWLLGVMRPEAAAQFEVDFEDLREPDDEEEHPPPAWLEDVLELAGRLHAGLSAEGGDDAPDEAERRLLSHLLLFHRRESKPEWWGYFDLREKTVAELVDEREAIADLTRDVSRAPEPHKRSLDYAFTFPPQEFKLDTGQVEDPTTDAGYNLVHVADDHVVIRRGKTADPPTPRALASGQPIDPKVLRNALIDLSKSVLADDERFPAVRALLRRARPRLAPGVVLGEDIASLSAAAIGLDRSILPVQGPPGTGKTFRGARMAVAAMRAGLRVGVTAQSHAAIQNFLHDVEDAADEQGWSFDGFYKGDDYESPHGLIDVADDNDAVEDDHRLVGGTAWLFARPAHRQAFDLLFIDEAGQFSLANAAAAGLAAKSLVFLGDPQQLPQVTQSDHPEGSGASVLEHLLQGAATIEPGRGVLLTETWRMHPDVCGFISERSYDSRLRSREACSLRRVDAGGAIAGTGLRAVPVEHEGRSQASVEEADAIAAACRDLLGGTRVTDDEGLERDLRADDIMVVAPYNLAVRSIRERVPDGVRVGTVDRFQGQQAAVVFYAMTCSAGEDVPRGLDFLFDSHRFNVAISRAQCLAVLVYSPRLLDADCRTLEAMGLVDGVCRFVELAEPVALGHVPAASS